MKPILHICSDYVKQNIYAQLVDNLNRIGIEQFVFSAVRTKEEALKRPLDIPPKLYYDIKNILTPKHRFLFTSKINLICDHLVVQKNWVGNCELIHSHFLYSDGAAARRLGVEFKKPYITAVRNTDLNIFMKYRPDLWPMAKSVLLDSAAVIFLSPAYRDQLISRLPNTLAKKVALKTVVIPSGVGSSWLEHQPLMSEQKKIIRALYVGDFTANKNISKILRSVEEFSRTRSVRLTLVGGGGKGEKDVEKDLANPRFQFVTRHKPIYDSNILRDLVRNHDIFIMPSIKETFGIVYLEALSQGLPIIYSRGQGVDGLLKNPKVGIAVDPHDIKSISNAISVLASRLDLRQMCINEASRFSWERIASRYKLLYDDIHSGRIVNQKSWDDDS